tara:strand:+ start:50 stop:631 length:582 start_codon:yes stop_codon:yes gene_type:complete
MNSQLIFFDFETTGLNPFSDEVIEYAFHNHSNNETLEGFIKPSAPISDTIYRITKITNEMLDAEKPLPECLKHFEEYLNKTNLIFVAHNGNNFDRFFLKKIVMKSPILQKVYYSWKFIDTIHLSKMVFTKRKSHSLLNLCKDLLIEPGTHRAMSDVIALMKVFDIMMKKIVGNDENKLKNIYSNPIIVWRYIY